MAATPNTGKTHSRYLRLLANGYNLSGDMRAVSSFGTQYDQADATGWSDGSMQWLAGKGKALVDGFTALFSNTATATGPTAAGAHTVVSAGGSFYVSIFIGVRAAPQIGDSTFSASLEQGGYTIQADDDAPVMITGSFFGSHVLSSSASVWGTALAAGTEINSTTNHTSIDGGAGSTSGFIAFLHIPQTTGAMASNSFAFKLQHSTNDSSWSDLGNFAADGASITAERISGSSTVNRYVRLVSTRTAGTAAPWATFIRL